MLCGVVLGRKHHVYLYLYVLYEPCALLAAAVCIQKFKEL